MYYKAIKIIHNQGGNKLVESGRVEKVAGY